MAPPPLVVIVTGQPCSGKTSLARRLAGELALPLFNKDGFKELLFDTLGWKDRPWSRKLGGAAIGMVYHCLEAELAAGRSCLVESNFEAQRDSGRFLEIQKRYAYTPVQILCQADGQVIYERFRQRALSGERHPGHVDHTTFDELAERLLAGKAQPLEIGGCLVEFDTTDFSRLDYSPIYQCLAPFFPDRVLSA